MAKRDSTLNSGW